MSAISLFQDFGHVHGTTSRSASKPRRSVLRRIYDSMIQSRQRRAERDIARFLGLTDGCLTDETERRMTEHLMRNHGFGH